MASNQTESDSSRQKAVDAVFVPTQSNHDFTNKVQGDLSFESLNEFTFFCFSKHINVNFFHYFNE